MDCIRSSCCWHRRYNSWVSSLDAFFRYFFDVFYSNSSWHIFKYSFINYALLQSEIEKLKYASGFICSSTHNLCIFSCKQGVIIMGQQEVYDFLCKNKGKWFTSREISEKLKVSIGSVTMSLKKLRKTNIIKYKNTGKRNTFMYKVDKK